MTPILYAHPFSSYCQKAIAGLYEKQAAFELRMLDSAEAMAALKAAWPLGKFPVLVVEGRALPEATIIIEWLDRAMPHAPRLIPADPDAALEVRLLDRAFDNYVMTPMQKIVGDRLRLEGQADPRGVEEARALLATSYAWIDARLAGRRWAAGDDFTMADLAAAPALFYADWVAPIPEEHARLRDYRARLLARPSIARAVEEARPHRGLFPGGAPDRD